MEKSFYKSLTELLELDKGVIQTVSMDTLARGIKSDVDSDVPVYIVSVNDFDRIVALIPIYVEQICEELVRFFDKDEDNNKMKTIFFEIKNGEQYNSYEVIIIKADNI